MSMFNVLHERSRILSLTGIIPFSSFGLLSPHSDCAEERIDRENRGLDSTVPLRAFVEIQGLESQAHHIVADIDGIPGIWYPAAADRPLTGRCASIYTCR